MSEYITKNQYGVKTFKDSKNLLAVDFSPAKTSFVEHMLTGAMVGGTIVAAVLHPIETFIAVIIVAVMFNKV